MDRSEVLSDSETVQLLDDVIDVGYTLRHLPLNAAADHIDLCHAKALVDSIRCMAVAEESLRCPAIAVASADGKYILVPFGISVTVYQTSSGARIQQLDGHTRLVTAIALHQANTHQVCTKIDHVHHGGAILNAIRFRTTTPSPDCTIRMSLGKRCSESRLAFHHSMNGQKQH